MSAQNAAPVLALVPPEPPPSTVAQPPAHTIDWPRRYARIRGVAVTCCWVGTIVPIGAAAAAPYLGDAVYAILIPCWFFLLACGSIVVFLTAMVTHTRADLHAAISAVVALVLNVALVGPAGRAGTEAYVSSHAGEMDRAAGAWAAAWGRSNGGSTEAALPRMFELGLLNPQAMDGGVKLQMRAPFAPPLFYADAAIKGGSRCGRLTPIGGRWYIFECQSSAEYSD